MKIRMFLLMAFLICLLTMLVSSAQCMHAFNDGIVEHAPTCTETGIKIRECLKCHEKVAEVIPALGHDISDDYEVVQPAKCLENGLAYVRCSRCNIVLEEKVIPAADHKNGEWIISKEATCIEDGRKEMYCQNCNKLISGEVIPATGHDEGEWKIIVEPTCTQEGTKQCFCTKCSAVIKEEIIPATGHDTGTWKTIKYSTCTENGIKQLYCNICGKVIDKATILELGHNYTENICSRCGYSDSKFENMPFVNNENGYSLHTVNTTVLNGGSYNLKLDLMGYRVRCLQRYLGQDEVKYGIYNSTTVELVKKFQTENNLEVTGEVDLKTWMAMGFTEEQWKTWDTYVHPSEYTEDMTRSEIIDKFIEIAYTYLGAEYVCGCAGTPDQGGDCSGFTLSCLYGIGINPEGYNSMQHNFNRYNSKVMWEDDHFKLIDLEDRMVGDLVFYYMNKQKTVMHVAIYLGDDKCIEACGQEIQIMNLYKNTMFIKGMKRVLYY